MIINAIKGFADVLPGEIETWQFVEAKAREVFVRYNFSEIRIPVVEKTELFSRSLGETTDIVEKEMYTFADQDTKGSLLTLRPEGTAGVVRAYLEAEMYKIEPVRKLYYLGPMFRRERPQKGRLRQFYQIGAEALGRNDPFVDAEILLLLNDFFLGIELKGLTLQLNSLGCVQCRPRYRQDLLSFALTRKENLCDNCQRRMERNPLRVLDCKDEGCQKITHGAPSILDYLCEECRTHFEKVKELLGSMELAYSLNPRMVRGLDYYCRTTFEWTSDQLGSQNTVAAGGRYDGLVEDIGGPPTPGVGFAMGMERLVLLLGRTIEEGAAPFLYVAWMGEAARAWAFATAHRLRQKGMIVEMEGEQKSLKSQMRRADKLRAMRQTLQRAREQNPSWVLIVGEQELQQGRIIIRNLNEGKQFEVDQSGFEEKLQELVAAEASS